MMEVFSYIGVFAVCLGLYAGLGYVVCYIEDRWL